MNHLSPTLKLLAASALLVGSGASLATITTFTDQAAFMAAVQLPGVDTYLGFSLTSPTPSPIVRSAGPYTYQGMVSTTSFFGAGSSVNPALSTNTASDTITFGSFGPIPVAAAGGNFFISDINGLFITGSVTVTAVDADGPVAVTINNAVATSFRGFVSNGTMTSLTVSAVQPVGAFNWPTVDNLTLGVLAPLVDDVFADGFESIGVAAPYVSTP